MFKRFFQILPPLLSVVVAIATMPARPASAHPLGNFTINRYSRLEMGQNHTSLIYIVDRAEVPAFQEREKIDANHNGQISPDEGNTYLVAERIRLQQNLHLTIAGKLTALQLVDQKIEFPAGQGGLFTQRVTLQFSADTLATTQQPVAISYRDDNFAGRLGWREVVVQSSDGIVLSGNPPTQDISRALTQYPQDMLNSPMAISQIDFEATTGTPAQTAVAPSPIAKLQAQLSSRPNAADPFADLINLPELTLGTAALALLLAFGWGAVHALSPGHGKTIVAAYLIGQRATIKHALFLGITTTITHTTGVFALGLITLFASQYIVPEKLYPWLEVISGGLVVVLGVSLLGNRISTLLKSSQTASQAHAHAEFAGMHDHGDGNTHSHVPPASTNWRSLLTLGISGGLLPCPSALVVMLSAIALQRVAFGLLLILVFSAGLAGVLIAIGILMVHAGKLTSRLSLTRFSFVQPVLRVAPVLSAFVITLAGLAITARAVALTVPI